MKNVIICFILLIGFQFMKAQSFQETVKYIVKTEIKEDGSEFPSRVVSLLSRGGISEELVTLTINDSELFEDIFITTLENPGLDGVSEVIKMQVEYLSCCAEVESYYYLIKEDNEIIPLPHLTNVYCDNTNTDSQYIFPNQPHGLENSIRETEFSYSDDFEIAYTNVKQNFTWENNEFTESKSTAITSY